MTSVQSRIVYKILTGSEWRCALAQGAWEGSDDDRRDGYIHFSCADQLAGTASKYFRNKPDLVLVAFEAERLGAALRWEPSRGGALFPHLHARLDPTLALWLQPLDLADDGAPILPSELP